MKMMYMITMNKIIREYINVNRYIYDMNGLYDVYDILYT